MIILFVIGVLLGVFAVLFALENVAIVTVSFYGWHITSSLSVILFLAVSSGIIITLLLLLPESISNYLKYKKLKKENSNLVEELRKQKELTVFAKTTPPKEEDIKKIEDGASV